MSCSIKRHKVLFDSAAAETGDWYRLDVRYDHDDERALQIKVTSGDTVTIEGTTKDQRGLLPEAVIASITEDDISTLKSYTEDSVDNLVGPWTYIRVSKTGTTGNAKVQGFI